MTTLDKITELKSSNSNSLRLKFLDLINDVFFLEKGVDKRATIAELKNKQSMSGANAWMLMCSIMIASIGLSIDSQAVIIGAMLISPLMSPILGIGLGIATNDKNALYHALKHFSGAVLIALVFSSVYFLLTPLDELTPQIEARTEPTFLDVLIAVFGGVAGILSIARKDITTTLPGVAIATALMPPLCVAGFGIANGEWSLASKAFYLFFLNTFFVTFATYVILRRMRFPYKTYTSPKEKKQNMCIVIIFSIMMIIPSVLIFNKVFDKYQRERKLNVFITEAFSKEDFNYLDGYILFPPDNPNKLILKVYGDRINDLRIPDMLDKLKLYELNEISKIEIISTSEIDLNKINQVRAELTGLEQKLSTQIDLLTKENQQRNSNLNRKDFFLTLDSTTLSRIDGDLKRLFPGIEKMNIGLTLNSDTSTTFTKVPIIMIDYEDMTKDQNRIIETYVKNLYDLDTLVILKAKL